MVDDGSTRDAGPIDGSFSRDASAVDAGLQPIALEDFCDELMGWVFSLREDCGCPGTADGLAMGIESCESSRLPPVESGQIAYDPDAAARWMARLRAATPHCAYPYAVIGRTFRDLQTTGGTFGGTTPAGGSCAFEGVGGGSWDECVPDSTCSIDFSQSSEPARCVQYVGIGDACDNDHYCGDLDAIYVEGISYSEDAVGSWCDGTDDPTSGRTIGTCRAQFAPGDPCVNNEQCATGYCSSGTCAEYLAARCTSDADCGTGFCCRERCVPHLCDNF